MVSVDMAIEITSSGMGARNGSDRGDRSGSPSCSTIDAAAQVKLISLELARWLAPGLATCRYACRMVGQHQTVEIANFAPGFVGQPERTRRPCAPGRKHT